MARRISGRHADDKTMEWARRTAEAQFDLNRVRSSRRLLITQFLVDPYFVPRHIRGLQLWGLPSDSQRSFPRPAYRNP